MEAALSVHPRRILAATAALCALAGGTAHATVVEHGSFADESYADGYDCTGFHVDVRGVASGSFRLREGKNAAAGVFFSLDRLTFSEVHTNATTGRSFTISGHFLANETTARNVSGSLFEVRSVKAGQQVIVRDAQGTLVARDNGLLQRTVLFDTGGDDVPGGTPVDVLSVRLAGNQDDFGRTCALAAQLTGA